MKALSLDGTEALSTFNRHIPSGHINKLKASSDAKNDTEELTFADDKNVNRIKSKACFAYSDSLERKRLNDELKEVWEDEH